jgi:ABC-type nickel/cobalt efflux system permease component RcnA
MDPEVRELATAAVTALQTMAANSSPHWTDVAGVFVALLVGGAQCGLIAWGIRIMRDSNLTRESRHIEVMAAFDRQHEESQHRHEEADREAQRRHEEVMAAFARQHEEAQHERDDSQGRHDEAMAALTALIERTAPTGNV